MEREEPIDIIFHLVNKLSANLIKIREKGDLYDNSQYPFSKHIRDQEDFISVIEDLIYEINKQKILPDRFLKLTASPCWTNIYTNKMKKYYKNFGQMRGL